MSRLQLLRTLSVVARAALFVLGACDSTPSLGSVDAGIAVDGAASGDARREDAPTAVLDASPADAEECFEPAIVCGGNCATCPNAPGVLTSGCEGLACVALSCDEGYELSAGACAPSAPTAWHLATVDMSARVGYWNSIAVDDAGHPHIAYWDGTNGALKYAHFSGLAWETETVDEGDVGWFASLALDSMGRPHIAYQDHRNRHLKCARWTDEMWQIEIVDSTGSTGESPSIAIDASDVVHVAYDGDSRSLRHALWNGTNWTIEIVSVSDEGTSLALDSSGRPRIVFRDNGDLRYASWDGSTWMIEDVAPTSTAAANARAFALALDPSDHPSIALFSTDLEPETDDDDLVFVRWNGASWDSQTVDSPGRIGDSPAIRFNSAGVPFVSYFDQSNGNLKVASLAGSTWTLETVDSAGVVGQFTSIAIDRFDRVHVSYYDNTREALKYAVYR